MTSFSGVTFVLFFFALLRFFRLYAFVEAAALRSIVLRYAGAPVATHVSFFFLFVYLEMPLFSEYFLCHFRFLFVWRVRRTFFPSKGWTFDVSLCENSIKQS